MAFTVKVTGALSFKPVDLQCPDCGYEENRTIDLRGIEDQEARDQAMNQEIKCPSCDDAVLERVWKGAPSIGKYTNNRSSGTLAARQASLRSRQRKSDDDIRHKHGVNYDDSIRSAQAQRIKKAIK